MTRPGTIRSSIDVGRCSANAWASQPVVKLRLHSGPPTRLPRWGPRSAGDASPLHPTALKNAQWGPRPLTALLLPHIFPICSVVAPCQHSTGNFPIHQVRNYLVSEVVSWERGASPSSVRRWTFTTGCQLAE